MADMEPEFKPDVVAALRLLIGAVAHMGASSPQGVHPNIARAGAMLDNPHAWSRAGDEPAIRWRGLPEWAAPVEAETPVPGAEVQDT